MPEIETGKNTQKRKPGQTVNIWGLDVTGTIDIQLWPEVINGNKQDVWRSGLFFGGRAGRER